MNQKTKYQIQKWLSIIMVILLFIIAFVIVNGAVSYGFYCWYMKIYVPLEDNQKPEITDITTDYKKILLPTGNYKYICRPKYVVKYKYDDKQYIGKYAKDVEYLNFDHNELSYDVWDNNSIADCIQKFINADESGRFIGASLENYWVLRKKPYAQNVCLYRKSSNCCDDSKGKCVQEVKHDCDDGYTSDAGFHITVIFVGLLFLGLNGLAIWGIYELCSNISYEYYRKIQNISAHILNNLETISAMSDRNCKKIYYQKTCSICKEQHTSILLKKCNHCVICKTCLIDMCKINACEVKCPYCRAISDRYSVKKLNRSLINKIHKLKEQCIDLEMGKQECTK
jgi:hypothetical protein